MTDLISIRRELLEQVASEFEHDNDRYMLGRGLRKVLDAPRQPEGKGLEVVAWQDAENPLYTTAERRVLHDWANNGYPIVELCRLSDAQRAIAELDRKVWEWSSAATAEAHRVDELKAERDTLRQQLDERDAEIMEQCRLNGMGAERELKLIAQRDKLAGLLREVRVIVAREVERWTRCRFVYSL